MTGRLRWVGLAGSACLAIAAYLAGAVPGAAPASRAEALWGTGPQFRVGLAIYLVGLVLLGGAWWRVGVQLRAGTGPSPRWLLVTAACWAAPLLVAPPLGSRDLYAYACQGAVWLDGHDPYTTGAAAGGCPWLAAVPDLWRETGAPYGPLALVAAAAAVGLARALTGTEPAALLVAIGGLWAAAVAGALLVAGFGPRLARACGLAPAPAAWLGLVTPLVLLHAVAGGHHDALVAGLLVAGLAVVAAPPTPRTGPAWWGAVAPAVASGAALGAAVAVKVTALAVVPFALVLAWRRGPGPAAGLLAGAVASFAALSLATGLGTGWTGALSGTGALVQWSSLPTGLGMAAGYLLWGLGAPGAFDAAVAVARAAGLVALAGVGAGLLLRSWRHRQQTGVVVAAAGATLAAVAVLGPVFYPWYALPALAVLAAATRSVEIRWWLAVATLVLTALVLPTGLGVPVLTKFPGALAVAAGTAVVAVALLRGTLLRRTPRGRRVPVR